jgi:putative holliday junction resolvase
MKIASLDIGDRWTGSAVSDPLGILAKPYKTVQTDQLPTLLQEFIDQGITTIVIGYPKTMRGTRSQQTEKVLSFKNSLEGQFPSLTFILWDERLSSKRAALLQQGSWKTSSQQEKLKIHARAAAFILESYLQGQHFIP